jgi:hypothetical protein
VSSALAVVVVDDDGFGTAANCNAGTAASSTIQAGVNAAAVGETVQVCPGTYAQAVNVNKSVVLRGARAGVDARDPSRTGLATTESLATGTGNAGKTPFDITAEDVTIDGFTVEGNTDGNNLGFGIVIGAGRSGAAIENNIIQNNIAGISLANDDPLKPATIRGNVIRNNNQPGPVSGTGIYSDQFNAGGALSGVSITQNMFTNNSNASVLLGSTSAAMPASAVSVAENSFIASGNAMLFFNTSNASISGNTVTDSTASQVVLGGGVHDVDVTGNVIRNGATRGIRIGDFGGGGTNQNLNVTCNLISGNPTAGLDIDLAAGAYTGPLIAEQNFWGAASGPTIASNPAGGGDTINDPNAAVDYVPFAAGTFAPISPAIRTGPRTGCASAADASGQEGNSGASSIPITVTLPSPQPQSVTVDYATSDGSATVADGDYLATAGTLGFAPGQTSKQIQVPVLGDTAVEPDETLKLTLSSSTDTVIGDAEATVTIANDDEPPTLPGPPVGGANRSPVAKRDHYKAEQGEKLSVKAPGVLKGDTDPDGDALTVSLVKGTKHGKLKLKASGAFKYKPDADYSGKDKFTYAVSDGRGGEAQAQVKLKVKP